VVCLNLVNVSGAKPMPITQIAQLLTGKYNPSPENAKNFHFFLDKLIRTCYIYNVRRFSMTDFEAINIAEGLDNNATEEQYIAAWQHLIDSGLSWRLQGWFGRTARAMIDEGYCCSPQAQSHRESPCTISLDDSRAKLTTNPTQNKTDIKCPR
jgi:hypothetical protein